jgi:hypothetical protein
MSASAQNSRSAPTILNVEIIYGHNYHTTGLYPSSCLLLKTQRFRGWVLSLCLQLDPTQLDPIDIHSLYLQIECSLRNAVL